MPVPQTRTIQISSIICDLLVCLFPVTYQTLWPTGPKMKEMKETERSLGMVLLTLLRV